MLVRIVEITFLAKTGKQGLFRLRLQLISSLIDLTNCDEKQCLGFGSLLDPYSTSFWILFKTIRDVCSSLVAHLSAVAATRVRFPASCQIMWKEKKKPGRSTVTWAHTKKQLDNFILFSSLSSCPVSLNFNLPPSPHFWYQFIPVLRIGIRSNRSYWQDPDPNWYFRICFSFFRDNKNVHHIYKKNLLLTVICSKATKR